MAWGVLKKMGKKFIGGKSDAKPATQARNDAGSETKKQSETGANEKPIFKLPQEIRGVSLKPEERAFLETGKALFIADMNGIDGEKFSSYVKMDKEIGKLDFYRENPDKPRQITNQTAVGEHSRTMVQYKTPDPNQANSKKIKF
jgi:hypothetical protein